MLATSGQREPYKLKGLSIARVVGSIIVGPQQERPRRRSAGQPTGMMGDLLILLEWTGAPTATGAAIRWKCHSIRSRLR